MSRMQSRYGAPESDLLNRRKTNNHGGSGDRAPVNVLMKGVYMSERFRVEIFDEVNNPADIKALIDKALDIESSIDCELIVFSCFMVELANEWRVKLDNIKWPDKPDTFIRVTMPDGACFDVVE